MAKDKDNKDEMANAIKNGDGGKTPVVADPDKARAVQEKIEADARAKVEAENADALAAARKMMQEQAERDKLRPLPPITQSVSAATARPDEDTVTMVFPKDLFIWAEPDESHPKRNKVSFKRGIQEVPVSLRDHWYLKANNVLSYDAHVSDKKSVA